jgi:hypothetical protein
MIRFAQNLFVTVRFQPFLLKENGKKPRNTPGRPKRKEKTTPEETNKKTHTIEKRKKHN